MTREEEQFWIRQSLRWTHAQAIEAQRAATVKQGAVHESAVGETDAPKG